MGMAKRLILPSGYDGVKVGGQWEGAHATFYGDMSGSETMRKYCIYMHVSSIIIYFF